MTRIRTTRWTLLCWFACGAVALGSVRSARAAEGDLSNGVAMDTPNVGPKDRVGYGFVGWQIPPAIDQNSTPPRTVQLLGEALAQPGNTVQQRVGYLADLGRTQSVKAIPSVQGAMKDPSALVRAQAAWAAQQIADPALVAPLNELLSDTNPRVRRAAVLALGTITSARTNDSPAILAAIQDADVTVQIAAINHSRTAGEIDAIIRQLPTLDSLSRIAATQIIGRTGDSARLSVLTPLIDKGLPERIAVIDAIGALKATAGRSLIIEQLSYPHPTVRRQAMAALIRFAPIDIVQEHAAILLKDADPSVQEAAARGLVPLPNSRVVADMTSMLSDPYAPLHEALRQALIKPVSPAVRQSIIDAMVPLLDSDQPRRQEDASFVLGRLQSNADMDRHLALAKYDKAGDVLVIAQAAESLGLIGDPRATPALLALSKYSKGGSMTSSSEIDSRIIANAMVALGRLGEARVIPDAKRAIQGDPQFTPENMKAAGAFAVGATGAIGDPALGALLQNLMNNTLESAATRAEAIKGLANLQMRSSLGAIQKLAQSDYSALVAWTAHWAIQQLGGPSIPFAPPVHPFRPSLSIEDRTPQSP